jgi:lysophospholipase L1-like esterase
MTPRRALPAFVLLGAVACGKGSTPGGGGPTEPTYPVTALVYYDENGNGALDPSEAVRLAQIDVVVGPVSAKSAPGGQVVVNGVPAGNQTLAIRTESVPPYFVPPSAVPVAVPQAAGQVLLGMRLPIGNNQPNVYLGVGDSLTVGEGSSDNQGYRVRLQNLLGAALGRAQVNQEGFAGRTSMRGAEKIDGSLNRNRPAYTLILYGTNDWNDQECQTAPVASCYTIDSLRKIVDEVKGYQSIPVLATLPPVNPAVNAGRNQWIDQMNELIKALARSEGAILADVNAAFKATGNLPSLFNPVDPAGVHPNDAGYDVMASAFSKAITGPRSPSSSSRGRSLFFAASAR